MNSSSNQKTVLVVEDDDCANKALCAILKIRGWKTISAKTVQDGIEALEKEPDVVVLDLMLPDGLGTQILNEAHKKSAKIPFIVFTGVNDEGLIQEVKSLGVDEFLRKPCCCEKLLDMIDRITLTRV